MADSPAAAAADAAAAGPSRTPRPQTPQEVQAAAVARLLANPERAVRLPGPPKEKELRAPRDMIKNVSGSSAGAGSGEFHVYKHARRREYERVKLMEDKAKKEEETAAFAKRQAELAASTDAKTLKNRAKRDKKKARAKGGAGAAGGEKKAEGAAAGDAAAAADGEDEEREGKRRKIARAAEGASIAFKRPAGDSDDEA
ncbi:DUF1168-domain-containing protein [Tilletiopsis washingtonensis]|uniref:DUF1168-domain-containing protein n=1 Tax=Tilletiopsis washingtonensis TaxID=58919 RepID=A0A316Z4X5_9BASI|nr:DUF1168-domain-containing protein [Tilletiopsis washingtonensis]PWN96144.1 DUF1168-domain-containing protein [Tilletiopsis washingtonensis]